MFTVLSLGVKDRTVLSVAHAALAARRPLNDPESGVWYT